jgi:hypothetical protein
MAMTKRKILDYKIVPDSSNAEPFVNFIKEQIIPKTKKHCLWIMIEFITTRKLQHMLTV